MSFTTWLKDQRTRDDAVGDLARDAKEDRNFPRNGTVGVYRDALYSAGACSDAIRTFHEAWFEFSGEKVSDDDDDDDDS